MCANVNNKSSNDMEDKIIELFRKNRIGEEKAIYLAHELLFLFSVSNRFSPEQMAEWFHNNYEEIAIAEGWQTQDKCKVEFKDLPESNRTTMIKVCERWLNGC